MVVTMMSCLVIAPIVYVYELEDRPFGMGAGGCVHGRVHGAWFRHDDAPLNCVQRDIQHLIRFVRGRGSSFHL